MSGPLLFALIFGSLLMLVNYFFLKSIKYLIIFMVKSGKIHFGYIYGFGVFGCFIIYFIMNFISQVKIDLMKILKKIFFFFKNIYLELYNTVSILGYCLLPIIFLSGANVVIDLKFFLFFKIINLLNWLFLIFFQVSYWNNTRCWGNSMG